MMKIARVHGAGDMRLDDIPVPVAGPKDVVVRILASGICGSDLGYVAHGGLGGVEPLTEPLPIGHEFAGVIHSVGSEVDGIRVGDRVAVNPDDGFIGGGGKEGGMAPFILIPNARLHSTIYPVPDHVPIDQAALAEPLSVALHGINLAKAGPGSKVAVLGAGPIGLSTVIGLRHRGVTDIVVADLSESRLAIARQLGATLTVNPARESLSDALARAHGEGERFGAHYVGTDIFIDAAGAPKALAEAFDIAKYRAAIVIIALYKAEFPVNLWKVMANEISITGSIALGRHAEFGECIDMLAKGALDVRPLITHHIPFEDCERAFATAADTNQSAKVILTFPEAA